MQKVIMMRQVELTRTQKNATPEHGDLTPSEHLKPERTQSFHTTSINARSGQMQFVSGVH